MANNTKAQRAAAEHKNLEVLFEFVEHWRAINDNFDTDRLNPGIDAIVDYESPKASANAQRTNVRIQMSGYSESGQIDIDESRELSTSKFHLRILPQWGNYHFEQNSGTLVYTSSSEKMGGDYEIRISPIPS